MPLALASERWHMFVSAMRRYVAKLLAGVACVHVEASLHAR